VTLCISTRFPFPRPTGLPSLQVIWPGLKNTDSGVDFSCEGEAGQSFVLALSTGDTETVHVSGDFSAVLISELVGTTFEANNKNWRSFSLSVTGHWKLLSFEVNQLPA
jgi:hypothetical protein